MDEMTNVRMRHKVVVTRYCGTASSVLDIQYEKINCDGTSISVLCVLYLFPFSYVSYIIIPLCLVD